MSFCFQCYVPGCDSDSILDPDVKFHQFPKSDLDFDWFKAIEEGIGHKFDRQRFSYSTNRICEKHFVPEDFGTIKGFRVLKRTAIPSLFKKIPIAPTLFQMRPCVIQPVAKNSMEPVIAPSKKKQIVVKKKETITLAMTKLKCRICLQSKGIAAINSCIPNSKVSIIEAVKKTFNINMKIENNFPHKICERCLKSLISACVLKREILTSQATLESLLKEHEESKKIQISNAISRFENPDENAIFIIKELPDDYEAVKHEPEMTIEGDQAAFIETLSDDEFIESESDEDEVEVSSGDESDAKEFEIHSVDEEPKDIEVYSFEEIKEEPTEYIEIISDESIVEPLDLDKMLKEALEKEKTQSQKRRYEKWPEEEEENNEKAKKMRNIQKEPQDGEKIPPAGEKQGRKKKGHKCLKCHAYYRLPYKLLWHIDESTEGCIELYDPKHECYLCHKKFMIMRSKKEHIKVDHKNDASPIGECPKCKKLNRHLKDPIHFERHMKSHQIDPVRVCSECGKEFYNKTPYYAHVFMHRASKGTHYCDICGYKGKDKFLIANHMKRHDKSSRIVCEICSKDVSNSQGLIIHKFRIHKIAEDGCYYCKTCNFCFLKRCQFKLHITRCNGPTGLKHPPDCVRVPRKDLDKNIFIRTLT